MNAYFQQLVDKSAQRLPSVRPRRPSLYESPVSSTALGFHSTDLASLRLEAARQGSSPEAVDRVPETTELRTAGDQVPHLIKSHKEPALSVKTSEQKGDKLSILIPQEASVSSNKEDQYQQSRESVYHPHQNTIQLPSGESDALGHVGESFAITEVPLPLKNHARRKLRPADERPTADHDPATNRKLDSDPGPNRKQQASAKRGNQVDRSRIEFDESESGNEQELLRVSPELFPERPVMQPLLRPQIDRSTVAPHAGPPQNTQGNTIRVTIGRIEVRAVMTPPTQAAGQQKPKAASPRISLKEYLEKQRGSNR